MIDLHAHILPGVDDGPATWDEALAIVRMAARDGITGMVATSHMMPDGPYDNGASTLLPLVGELQRRVDEAGIGVNVYPGGEVRLTPEVVDHIRAGRALTYCDAGHYLLLEMPATEIPRYTKDVLFALQLEGITPILAHPERNSDVIQDAGRVWELVTRGALIQLTARSLTERGGVGVTARRLLRQGLVHFLGTDAHGTSRRPPLIRPYVEWLRGSVSAEDDVERLVRRHAELVIGGEKISFESPERPGSVRVRRQDLLNRRFGWWNSAIHLSYELLSR